MVGGDWRTCPPLTVEEVERWYQSVCADPLCWIIAVEGRCVGTTRLHGLDEENRRARYAIGLFSPEHRGQGIGTTVTRLVLTYAFEALHLHRVDLRVLEFNHRAIACYERCGFVREGVERDGGWIAGEWQSDVIMSILEHEYQRIAEEWPQTAIT
jgi:RimJ/RimL family protein N-acetyltransferase